MRYEMGDFEQNPTIQDFLNRWNNSTQEVRLLDDCLDASEAVSSPGLAVPGAFYLERTAADLGGLPAPTANARGEEEEGYLTTAAAQPLAEECQKKERWNKPTTSPGWPAPDGFYLEQAAADHASVLPAPTPSARGEEVLEEGRYLAAAAQQLAEERQPRKKKGRRN